VRRPPPELGADTEAVLAEVAQLGSAASESTGLGRADKE
jgi:hypothetical protein